jgi:hypothetical protein
MGKPSQVVVLVEDERQQRFVRRYLYRLGFPPRDIRFEPLSAGKGSGAQWVLDRYTEAITAYHSRSARATTALVVAIDADDCSVAERQQQFRDHAARNNGERIVHLIPKWSVETWILCLSGATVDENQTYRRTPDIDEKIPAAAATFFEWSRPNVTPPDHCIPSLLAAIPEVLRLE